MAFEFFIGDRVQTCYGPGIIKRRTTWRSKIVEMNDFEAKEFSANCKMQKGEKYQEDWVELFVEVDGFIRCVQASDVKLLKGREYANEEGLGYFAVKNR